MSTKTAIEWTDATWNPVTGCTKVSAGCKHCYAERKWPRLAGNPKTVYYGRQFADVLTHGDRLDQPIRWTKPRMIFVNSMSDLFHEAVPDDFIDSVFGVMWACLWGRNEKPGHVFQVLTKRAGRMRDYLLQDRREYWARAAVNYGGGIDPDLIWDQVMGADGPHPRIWIGVSVEDQKSAEERIPTLLEMPAAVRWISAEPLQGPVNLTAILPEYPERLDALEGRLYCDEPHTAGSYEEVPRLDWVVVGGESGPKARPMHPDWARSLRDQCNAAGVPFLFKQWGEFATEYQSGRDINFCYDRSTTGGWIEMDGTYSLGDGAAPSDPMTAEHVFRIGKKAAGRLLDGREWNQYPEISS